MPRTWIGGRFGGTISSQLIWLGILAGMLLAVPFVTVSLLGLSRPVFVTVHVVVTGAVIIAFARQTNLHLQDLLVRWPLGLVVGALASAYVISYVLNFPYSPVPDGPALILNIAGLGIAYAIVDAFALSVLPVLIVWQIAERLGWASSFAGIGVTVLLSLLASIGLTLAYHAGFPEFQSIAIVAPVIGNLIFTLAYLVSGSPVAPLLSHVALHVTAVLFAFHTSLPLPPHAG